MDYHPHTFAISEVVEELFFPNGSGVHCGTPKVNWVLNRLAVGFVLHRIVAELQELLLERAILNRIMAVYT